MHSQLLFSFFRAVFVKKDVKSLVFQLASTRPISVVFTFIAFTWENCKRVRRATKIPLNSGWKNSEGNKGVREYHHYPLDNPCTPEHPALGKPTSNEVERKESPKNGLAAAVTAVVQKQKIKKKFERSVR